MMISKKKYRTFLNSCLLVVVVGYLLGCSNQRLENKPIIKKDTLPFSPNIQKPPATYSDTLTIAVNAAVFYNPDSIQMEKIKGVNKEMVFKSMEHDCFFQQRNAKMVIAKYWPKVKVIESAKARYLLFVKSDKSNSLIDLNTKNDICGIFLFEKDKSPILIDMMNVDTELGFYFKK